MLLGVHGHQFPPQREEVLRNLRIPIWTLLNMDWGYYKRFVRPIDTVVLRIYDPDCMGHPPEQWADRCHREMVQIVADGGGDPRRFILQGANELKLGVEHNNHGWEVWDDRAHADLILEWWRRFLATLRGFRPAYRVGAPAESPGHNDTDGYNDVRRYAAAGIYDLMDVYLGHFYAEGPAQQGFDDPQRIYYADRVRTLRQQLDETHPNLPIIISECNRKDIEIGDVLGELDRYCGRIADAVDGLTWFVWSSGDPSFGTFQLSEIADQMPRFQSLIDKYAGAQPGPTPEPEPEPPTPPSGDAIAQKYNLIVSETAEIGARFEDDTSGQVELVAVMAPNASGSLRTADGQHGVDGAGTLSVIMAASSAYFPQNGQHGPWVATCAGARVEGLGMMPSHHHPKTIFYRKSPKPPDPQPPTGLAWRGAFAAHAASHPEVGQPLGEIAYAPEPGPWICAIQVSKTHILCWNGARVIQLPRAS